VDAERVARHVERSLMRVTALTPRTGYERSAAVAKHAHEQGISLRQACLDLGVLRAQEFAELVRPETMFNPTQT
jgi:fumarate hydratase class II